MAQTDALRPYTPAPPTQLGEDKRYLQAELQKLGAAISSIRSVMQQLETRIAALGG